MKFLCGSCRTKYQISGEKVRGKILTIRCKKCGAKILVRESLARESAVGTEVAPVAKDERVQAEANVRRKSASVSQARVGGSAALASAFDVAMGGGSAEADDMPTSIAPVPANLENAGVEWYIAIDGEQHGPYAFAEVVRKVVGGEAQGRHYVWHDGMDNWTRIREVKDLNPYLPSDKKKPPPPPPPMDTVEDDPTQGNAKVVDLAQKRRQLALQAAAHQDVEEDEEATRTDSPIEPGIATTSERAEQLDSVLNEALGIAGEGRTTQAEPESAGGELGKAAIAVSGVADGPDAVKLSPLEDVINFENNEDIFANVPRASEADMVPRESTRFFVAAAGVNSRKSKNKIAMLMGGFVVLLFVAFMGAWASGVIEISIPGLGNPFARDGSDGALAENGSVTDTDREGIDQLINGPKKVVKKTPTRRHRTRRPKSEGGGYVDDNSETGAGGTRGAGEAESLTIGSLGNDSLGNPIALPEAKLPTGAPGLPPVDTETLPESSIRQVVNANKRSVSICYQQSLKAQEALRGKLEIRVTVSPSGSVTRAYVQTTQFKGSKLGKCIVDKIRGWRSPSFNGEPQQVVVPFVLESGA